MCEKICGLPLHTISELFQSEGYQAKAQLDDKRAFIDSAALGMKFRLFLYDPEYFDGETYYQNYMFDAGYRLSSGSNIKQLAIQCSSFNCEYRFLKAFVTPTDSGGIVAIQFDNNFENGNLDLFKKAFQFFLHGLEIFQRNIINTPAYMGDDSAHIHDQAVASVSGLFPELDKALGLYRKAADLGFAGSMNNLGDFYERGELVLSSEVFSVYWYTRAAERGEPTAYLSLAAILARLSQDNAMLIEALKYANLAVEYLSDGINRRAAIAVRKNIETLLDDQEIERADKLTNDWKPLYQEGRLLSDSIRSEGDRMIDGCLVN